jgi:hypothetical protein
MKKKKMYIVKREVLAYDIKDAMTAKGKIFSVEECVQPPPETIPTIGFKPKKK